MRYTQPQSGARIDWSNPITDGLIDVIDCSAATPKSLLLGIAAVPFGTKPVKGVSRQGVVTDASAAFGGWSFTSPTGAHSTARQTHILVGQYNSVAGTYAGLMCVSNGDGSAGVLSAQHLNNSAVTAYPSGNTINVSEALYIDSLPHVFAYVQSASTLAMYKDSAKLGEASNTAAAYSTSKLVLFGERSASASYATKGKAALYLLYNRALSQSELKSISGNPWQIFADNKKPIFIGVGAAPSGLSITADLATASASGYAATVNLQSAIHTTLATATASGFTASVGTGNAITATLATATASGQTATVNRQSNITATQAVASASGQIATVNRQLAIAATLATATASGQLATVNLQRSVVSTQAVATATGYAASVQLGNDLSISATQAIATASGLDAVINRQLSIASSVAVATASGFDESISNGASIAASYGLASADGYQAQINLQREVAASLATASASGFTAAISTSTGTAVWPTPDQVLSGITYGPTGADYTGTATAGGYPTAADIAAAVRFDLTAELARIDAAISSRSTVAAIMGYDE